MIPNAVFDIGQVLMSWHPQLEPYFGAAAAREVEQAIWGSGLWTEMDRGVIPEAELIRRMELLAPNSRPQLETVLNHLELVADARDYAIPWIRALKAAGHRVFYLSNYSRLLRSTVPQAIDFLPEMEGGVFSCDVGLLKPDPRIYERLCRDYALRPEECLFIDDRQENVDGAIACGFHAVRFDGYAESYETVMNMLG